MLIVADGLINEEKGYRPHPALASWLKPLSRMHTLWFEVPAMVPLQWLAALQGCPPAALLVPSAADLPEDTRQCWVASPYHAVVSRDRLHVMPDALFPWSGDDADWICVTLNPLLAEEGMRLCRAGDALLLASRQPLQARPLDFAHVAGHTLPDRHPDGADGGRLMRLQAEMQMFLHQHPSPLRREGHEPAVHGLWLWGDCDYPCQLPAAMPAVATRNPFLRSVTDGREARLTISEVDRLGELLPPHASVPSQLLLAGDRHAVLLRRRMLPRLGKPGWLPRSARPASELFATISAAIV